MSQQRFGMYIDCVDMDEREIYVENNETKVGDIKIYWDKYN